jgi:hypothetical protein
MPITLPQISRRHFLTTIAAGSATCLVRDTFGADSACDANRFALLADTHIAGDPKAVARGVNLHDNLQAVVREIMAGESGPAGVLIGGDLALAKGTSEDYATLLSVLQPLRQRGRPIHLSLGNHDNRERFWQALGEAERKSSRLDQKHVLVVPAPLVNWFVLDSLDQTDKTPGTLGDEQLKWLGEALDQAADRPAVVMVHHNPNFGTASTGLVDTQPLCEVLQPRRHVKAVFYGHTHAWDVAQRDGLHWVNLPPTAYVFAAGKPSGWVDARVTADGMTLEVRCLDSQHKQHGQRVELKWRV